MQRTAEPLQRDERAQLLVERAQMEDLAQRRGLRIIQLTSALRRAHAIADEAILAGWRAVLK